MLERIPFDPKELEPVATLPGMIPGMLPGAPGVTVFNTPISRKENFWRFINGEGPLWIPHFKEFAMLSPSCIPDNWARGSVTTARPTTPDQWGGKDMFGVEWEYDPPSRGSMVRPGDPLVPDVERWEDFVTFPDPESWDWAGSAREAQSLLEGGAVVKMVFMTGLFERLVSLTGMENALVSLIDEEGQEAVHRFFDKLCGLYETIFQKAAEHFHPDAIWFHDDWGSQRSPMFSYDTVEEMLLPYLRRVVAAAHRNGMIFEFHSCGMVEPLVPLMVEAGCDMWNGQDMNDKVEMARRYGDKLVVDSFPDLISPDAPEEEARANVRAYLERFRGLRTYIGLHRPEHPLEQAISYELSRKLYNEIYSE